MFGSKVILWFVMRSRSTVFTRCLSNLSNLDVFFEPYYSAAAYGPERVFQGFCRQVPEESDLSFEKVRGMLEQASRRSIFVKDCASGMPPERYVSLPQNYKHAFLIRDPLKVVRSIYSILSNSPKKRKAFEANQLAELIGYRQMALLFREIASRDNKLPLIIESRKLVKKPNSVLKEFCRYADLPYVGSMHKFSSETEFPKDWWVSRSDQLLNSGTNTYGNAIRSVRLKEHRRQAQSEVMLPRPYLRVVEVLQPYYDELKAHAELDPSKEIVH